MPWKRTLGDELGLSGRVVAVGCVVAVNSWVVGVFSNGDVDNGAVRKSSNPSGRGRMNYGTVCGRRRLYRVGQVTFESEAYRQTRVKGCFQKMTVNHWLNPNLEARE